MSEEKDKVEKSDKVNEEKEPDKKVPYGQLWRYATAYDKEWIKSLILNVHSESYNFRLFLNELSDLIQNSKKRLWFFLPCWQHLG